MKSFLQKPGQGEKFRVKNFSPFTLSLTKSILIGLLVLSPAQVLAGSTRTVYSQDAQGSQDMSLKIWKGYGLTINFIPTGETIKQVWIGDPTRISFTSNCQKADNNSNSNCSNGTVLFLRQIKPISFPNMTNSTDGSTQITVLTTGSGGQKQYQFKLTPATGEPSYTSLVIKPDSERPLYTAKTQVPTLLTTTENRIPPVSTVRSPLPQPMVATVESQNRKTNPTLVSPGTILLRNDANTLVLGLAIGNRNGQVKVGSTTWNKVQDAIRLLRQGKSQEEAISRAGISFQVFNQLIEWGQRYGI
ncbi:hypothetical protein [Nostoc sp.]|uniref:hypothetical protein n=1 Tax=Nostoc sp. TaxID=1180 RepID=UPI003594435F